MARDVVVLPVRFAVGPHAVQATTRALTLEAVFVRSMARPHPGVKVALRLYLPSGAPEDLLASVEERPAPEHETGFWAVFQNLGPLARARLESVLQPPMMNAVPPSCPPARQVITPPPPIGSAAARDERKPAPARSVPLPGPDARCTRRVAASLRVSFRTVQELREELTLNISAGGMFVRTDSPPPLRELVEVTIELPGESEPVTAQAQVVHRVTREEARLSGRPAGVGVQFVEANDRFREQVDAYLARSR